MSEHLLTLHEASILSDLAEAWNRYTLLPDHGPDDVNDFKKAVHDAQRIVLARTGRRQLQGVEDNGTIKELAEQLKALTYSEKSHGFTTETI